MKTYIEKEIEYLRIEVKAILIDVKEYTGLSLFRFMEKSTRKLIKLSKRIDELELVLKNITHDVLLESVKKIDDKDACNCKRPAVSPPKPHRANKIQRCGICKKPLKQKFQY